MPATSDSTSLLTVMFTDVVGSTELRTRLGDEAAQAILDAHGRVVRRAVATNGGRVVKSLGDGYLAVFDSPRHALAAAVAIQRDQDQPVAVRIGLHTGEVLEHDGDVLGEAVHAAARIAELAEGGQIVAADVVRQIAGTVPGLSFHDRGSVQLRGFPDAWRVVEVRWRVDDIGLDRVRLFGPPEIRRASAVVAVDTRKAIAVLAYLAAEGGPVSRETLAGLLWSESSQTKAAGRVASHALGAAGGPRRRRRERSGRRAPAERGVERRLCAVQRPSPIRRTRRLGGSRLALPGGLPRRTHPPRCSRVRALATPHRRPIPASSRSDTRSTLRSCLRR